jgi:D-glycero-alpha-D-manno-heptose-7-phosphate kinase
MIITRTPFRLSFFGGGTDYKAWYSEHGGLSIGTTFQKYCYISCRPLPPFFEYKTRVVYSKTELVHNNHEVHHPAIRGCLKYLGVEQGLEIHHDGDLPARSGLGSSSSFTVGCLMALHALRHQMPTKRDLADQAIKVEQDILKENVGVQDQIFAAYGGMQVIQIDRNGDYEVAPLILPPDYARAVEEHVLIGFTGQTRMATNLAGAQIESIQKGKSRMDEIHAIAKEALKCFTAKADLPKVGELLDASWRLKRSLASGVTTDSIDQMYETARKAGAYGGKLLGAGGGGFIMFFAPPYRHEQIKEALSEIKVWVPFKFDKTGAQVIFHTDET